MKQDTILLAVAGFAIAGGLSYLAFELGKARVSLDNVTTSPTVGALLGLSTRR